MISDDAEMTLRRHIEALANAALATKMAADTAALELRDLRTMIEANAVAIRDTKESTAGACRALAKSHEAIMAGVTAILAHVARVPQ